MAGPWEKYGAKPWERYATTPSKPGHVLSEEIPAAPQPEGLKELTGGWVNRDLFVGAGGMLGAAGGGGAGLMTGPGAPAAVPAGVLAGGALGAAGGSILFDNLDAAVRYFQGDERGVDTVESVKRAAKEGVVDLGFSAGTMAAGPILRRSGKAVVGKALGVLNPESKRIADLAATRGVELGAAHVSPRKSVKAATRILGVFPFVGTPFRKGQQDVVGQIDDYAADVLNTLAPTSTMQKVSKGLSEKVVRRYRATDRVASALYDRFYQIADGLSVKNIVPSNPIKEALAGIEAKQAREAIELTTGEPMKGFGSDTVGEYLDQLRNLPDLLTVEQARGLERSFNQMLRRAVTEGFDVSRLADIKGGLEAAKNSLDVSRLPTEEADAVLGAWRRANKFWGETQALYGRTTAKRFGRVDKNIFNRGVFKAGTKEADEIFSDVYSTRSLGALSDLRKLVGQRHFQRAARKHIETALQNSIIPAKEGQALDQLFSASKFEKSLGLDTPEGRDMMQEMLKGSDVTMRDWDQFIEVAKTATNIEIRDPSTFLTRRVVLAGAAGILGGVVVGAGKLSFTAAALITGTARMGARGLMSGHQLHLLTRILSDSTADHVRRTSLMRILRKAADDEE